MTTLTQHACTPRSSNALPLVRILTRAFALWNSRRALADLSPEQLKDVGVSAAQADQEAKRAVWDVPANWRD